MTPRVAIVMGVAGSGKTTLGKELAARLGWSFAEGDDFHSPANIAKMSAGIALSDADRWPWLDAIAGWIRAQTSQGTSCVVACSALKRTYRERLRAAWPEARLVYLQVDREVLQKRIGARREHFFPERLLDSQFRDLEPPGADENPLVVSASDVDAMVGLIVPSLRA